MIDPVHDRMPVILRPESYDRWLSPLEPDPRDLMVPHPSEPMTMWPVSLDVNKPDNDDASILAPVQPPPEPTSRLDL
jgi:putative SOS response-associated peptidase YedK